MVVNERRQAAFFLVFICFCATGGGFYLGRGYGFPAALCLFPAAAAVFTALKVTKND